MSDDDSDSTQGAGRATLRRLMEAVGKACPRLLYEKREGQKLYGLRYRELRDENEHLKTTLARWLEWARMHGHLDHAAGIADDSRRQISSENVDVMAPPQREAVENQSESAATPQPDNREDSGGCHARLVGCSSFWFVEARHTYDIDKVAREYRKAYDALPHHARPSALVVWGGLNMGSTIVHDALKHYGLPVIRLGRSVARNYDNAGEIPHVVGEFYRFMSDFNDFVSPAQQSCGRDAAGSDKMSGRHERERVAVSDLVQVEVNAFVPSGEASDVGFSHRCSWSSLFPTNVKRMHHYQRGRTSITGLVL